MSNITVPIPPILATKDRVRKSKYEYLNNYLNLLCSSYPTPEERENSEIAEMQHNQFHAKPFDKRVCKFYLIIYANFFFR